MELMFFFPLFVFLAAALSAAKFETERQRRETLRLLELTFTDRGPNSDDWRRFISEVSR